MNELTVNIKICDRVYPMKVRAEEEARVRAAGKLINEQAKAYSDQFGIYDKQDLLAMVSFDCLINTLKDKNEMTPEQQLLIEQIDTLTNLIDQTFTNQAHSQLEVL